MSDINHDLMAMAREHAIEMRELIEAHNREVERLREIIRRMDGLTDDARSALAIVRQSAREALGDG